MPRKSPTRQRLFAVLFALPILAVVSPHAQAVDPAVVEVLQVRAYRQQELQAVVSGFVVNERGAVLTSAHALRRAERFTVTLGEGRAEVVAALAWRDEGADIALLNATGVGAVPLVFAAGGLDAGRRVSTAWRAADGRLLTASGALGVAAGDDPDAPYQHNAMVTADGYGAPLLDECGRAVGINRRKLGVWRGFASARAGDPEGVVFATAAPRILALLAAKEVSYQAHAGPCAPGEQAALDAAEVARAQAEAATEQAAAATAQAEAAEDAAAQARRQAEQAQQRADLSAAERDELQAELQRAVEEKEQAAAAAQRAADEAAQVAQTAAEQAARARQVARRTAQKNRRTLILIVIGGATVGLLALLVFIRRGRAARRQVATAEAKALDAERRAEGPDPNSRPGWSFTAVADESANEFGDESGVESAGDSVAEPTTESTAQSAADFYVSMAVLQAAEQGVRIGRNPDSCDYVVAAAAVSREHCRVFLADGRLMLEDLKSANGSCIGARKLEAHAPQQIQDGDRIVLGNIVFQVAYVA